MNGDESFHATLLIVSVVYGSVLVFENLVEYQELLAYADIPELEDLDGAASELIRLQEFYKLYPHNITKGEMSAPMQFHFFPFQNKFQSD